MKVIICFLMVAGVVACKSTEPANMAGSSTASPDPEARKMAELFWAKIDSSRMSFTDADVNFMNGMISHHAQALIMSRLAPENDASPELQVLASRIINAQNDEIATMQKWLRDRNLPVPMVHINGLNLMIHGGSHHGGHTDHSNMPGMLSQAQLEELAAAKGIEFDRLFLEYMINHHNGAVIMVKDLFNTDGAAQDEEAFRLASDIQVDQITEIERMKLMLENRLNKSK